MDECDDEQPPCRLHLPNMLVRMPSIRRVGLPGSSEVAKVAGG